MDDCCNEQYGDRVLDSSSYIIYGNNVADQNHGKETAIQVGSHPLGKKIQMKKMEETCVQVSRPVSTLKKSGASQSQAIENENTKQFKNFPVPYCRIRLDSIVKLKDSTRKLLRLLEDIQSKMHSKALPPPETSERKTKSIQSFDGIHSVTDFEAAPALKKLETQTKTINTIYIEDEDDDCSIFKRLTRKCNCLNQIEYNDFIIHFNEDTKYCTSTIGEIIKNMRILKKFLYMGGRYTKNALIFLNEGLADSSYTEKVEITQGCAHTDMCNVFEDQSIVVTCISLPCKSELYGDSMTQNLAATFLYRLAQLEEGRRYLKFTSKITNDIKMLLRKRGSKLDLDTSESLKATVDLMHPPMTQHVNVTYYCRPIDEGYGNEAINALLQFRKYMTLDELFTHLDMLQKLSNEERSSKVLTSFLPSLIILFKQMLKEYNNSEMNIIITNILNNIVSSKMMKKDEPLPPKTMIIADIATEPIKMKNEMIQMPPPKKNGSKKASNKSKSHLSETLNKFRLASRRKVSEWEPPHLLNKSKKISKDRSHIIIVPIDKDKAFVKNYINNNIKEHHNSPHITL